MTAVIWAVSGIVTVVVAVGAFLWSVKRTRSE